MNWLSYVKHFTVLLIKSLLLLFMELMGILVVPLAILFSSKDSEHLPHWAFWWCNEWDGINGRANNNHWVKRWGYEGVKKFHVRFLWLAIRNRASNFSQFLGKQNPEPWETFRASVPIPFTKKRFKITWGYTSYYPGDGPASLAKMPKKNFTTSISLRERL